MDRVLGRSAGSGLEDLARAVADKPNQAMLVQSIDAVTGERAAGVVGRSGSALVGTGPDRDFVSLSQRGRDGVQTEIQVRGAKGAFGAFDADGHFVGTEALTRTMSNVAYAVENRSDSPVLAATRAAGVRGEAAVLLDLSPGKESAVTRIQYGNRIVDYAAREGQMTMIERDPATNAVRESAMIRSPDIRVDGRGHVSMDAAAQAVLNDHVKTYAAGRSGQDFAQAHPLEATQFASLRDAASTSAVADLGTPSVPVRSGVPDVEATGTAATVRAAGLREHATPVALGSGTTPSERRTDASRGFGD